MSQRREIEAESIALLYEGPVCGLRVLLRNRSGAARSFWFYFVAFDATGRGIAHADGGGVVSGAPNDTIEFNMLRWWDLPTAGGPVTCERIAHYELDLSRSFAVPYP